MYISHFLLLQFLLFHPLYTLYFISYFCLSDVFLKITNVYINDLGIFVCVKRVCYLPMYREIKTGTQFHLFKSFMYLLSYSQSDNV